jgi:hypothetical protein
MVYFHSRLMVPKRRANVNWAALGERIDPPGPSSDGALIGVDLEKPIYQWYSLIQRPRFMATHPGGRGRIIVLAPFKM